MKSKTTLAGIIVLMSTLLLTLISCKKEPADPSKPTASFTVFPLTGDSSTVFTFDASASFDEKDASVQLQVRWDYEGNGSWDTDWSSTKTASYSYGHEGNFSPFLQVKNTSEVTDIASDSVMVHNGFYGTGITTDRRDGQTYYTITIGNQTWFYENLNYETTDSWWYENSAVNGEKYGRLYNWEAALSACPDGWHLPEDYEWIELELFLGMSPTVVNSDNFRGTDEGNQLKSESGWLNAGNGNNKSGFTGLPGGQRSAGGAFSDLGISGSWWSSTVVIQAYPWQRTLHADFEKIARNSTFKSRALSIRCIKD